jgi:hypothetical protein
LPSETQQDYEANLTGWVNTLQPSSPGEGESVARIADLSFRLRRLQRLEETHWAAALERAFASSVPFKTLNGAHQALQALLPMVETVGGLPGNVGVQALRELLPPIGSVQAMVSAIEELPFSFKYALEDAHSRLKKSVLAETIDGVVTRSLVEAARNAMLMLRSRIPAWEKRAANEKARLADEMLLGDDKELKRFERHRSAINKALDGELARLKMVRELGQTSSGSSVGMFSVELRVIGAAACRESVSYSSST